MDGAIHAGVRKRCSMNDIYRYGRPQLATRTRKIARKMEENRTLAQMAEKNFDVKQFDLSSLEPQLDFNSKFFIRFCTIAADIKSKFSHTVVHTVAYNV